MKSIAQTDFLSLFTESIFGTKLCPKCRLKKPLSKFSTRDSKKLLPCSYCRACQRAYCRNHYKSYKNLHNTRRYSRMKSERQNNWQLVTEHLKDKYCVDCGEAEASVLEFDHVRGKKCGNVSEMIYRSSWQAIQIELSKCEIRCANCHRRKTVKQLGWKVRN